MSKASITTDIQTGTVKQPAVKAAAVQAVVAPRPDTIVITDYTHVCFAVAAHLIRSGYIISPHTMPEVYQATGQATLTLIRGNPDAHAVALAESAETHAIALQRVEFDKQVAEAAKQMMEATARTEKQARIAEAIAAQRATLRALEQEAFAA